ncbi:MAG: hypothetical protein IPK92_16060 [Nitrospira sp.]|nr:hypothetical protein [Nitrospira sp.]
MTNQSYSHRARVIVGLALCWGSVVSGGILSDNALAQSEQPIAYIGHGAFFDHSGNQIPLTMAFVEQAQAWYRKDLLTGLDKGKKKAFARFEGRLREGVTMQGQERLVVHQRSLDWLLANSLKYKDDDRTLGKLRALEYALLWQVPKQPSQHIADKRDAFKLNPKLAKRLASPQFKPSGAIQLRSATTNSGQSYIDECTAAKVPIPPTINQMDPAGLTGWKSQGFIPPAEQFIVGTPAELRTYKSTTPEGMCYALPRYTDGTKTMVSLDGVICLSQETSKVCFWDNSKNGSSFSFPAGTRIPIGVPNATIDPAGRYQAGGAELAIGNPGGVCTDCHAGENPYITHPKSNLGGGVLWESLSVAPQNLPTFAPKRYDPLVAASWPQNQFSQAGSTVPNVCKGCHINGSAGRFPHLSNQLPGYCGTVLTQAYHRTMPIGSPGSQIAAGDAFKNSWCNAPPNMASADGDPPPVDSDVGSIWESTGAACAGDSCPGWKRLDNNSKTLHIAAGGNALYQLHNDGWIWRYTGTPCNGESCPGWQRLDNNQKTVAIAADGDQLYQLHNDGWIWRYTGTLCNGESCPGWQRLDNNQKTVSIVAAGGALYQLHNDGWIWRYTGTACSSESCPGWQRLDNNQKTVAIAADGDQLYQLHNDGWTWRYTGTPCNGESCPGWQRLDNNQKTVSIVAAGGALYQLHNDGWIWRYTGTPCNGESCPGWQRLDNNQKTIAIRAAGSQLYQLHNDGWIWRYTGTPCNGESCPGWQRLDNNGHTSSIVAAGNKLYQLHAAPLYQLHSDGRIWRYTGPACAGESCPGWHQLDNNPKTKAIVAAGRDLYQLHNDGWIWRYTGTPCAGESCPGWQRLDNNGHTKAIAAAGRDLYQLHTDGRIWRYTGNPCNGDSCPSWQQLDNNRKTVAIVAAGRDLFQLHTDGWIWRYTGTPCAGESCSGLQRLDHNGYTKVIAAAGRDLYQLHTDGRIWRYTGNPCNGDSCPSWQQLDNNRKTVAIVAAGRDLFQLHTDGWIWRYTGTPCTGESCPSWQRLDNNPHTAMIAAATTKLFQLHDTGAIWKSFQTACNGDSCPGWQRLDNNAKSKAIIVGGFGE